jgi:hypothetical protein
LISLLLATALTAPASQPASAPTAQADLNIRVVYAHNEGAARDPKTSVPFKLDPKINDLLPLLKNLVYDTYALREQKSVKLIVDGPTVTQLLPGGRHLNITAKGYAKKKGKAQTQIELEIPELKFKAKATVMAGATLVVGGPKLEDGALLFALTATSLGP